jgi:hypothetical protein
MAALLPSLLMLWSYTTSTGLTVFTDLGAGHRRRGHLRLPQGAPGEHWPGGGTG